MRWRPSFVLALALLVVPPFAASAPAPAAPSVAQPALLLDVGSPAAGSWSADAKPSSGTTFVATTASAIDTSGVPNPAPQAVYQTQRWGSSFTYTLAGLTPGAPYTVRLHFVESFWTAENRRIFNVFVNGAPAAWNFDIFAAAGAGNRATVRSFGTNATAAGQISIRFSALKDNATVAAIEAQPAGLIPASPVDNTTNHSDALRTSWNPQEQALTAGNVSPSTFGLLKTFAVDGSVDAQPLVAAGVYIPTLGARRDLLLIATEKDSVYAVDPNSGALIWRRGLAGSGERSVLSTDVGGCPDLAPDIGITGTPVIDRARNALYVDAQTFSTSTRTFHHRIHALALSSGADLVTPAEVSGSAAVGGASLTFSPQWERQRAGLTLSNGLLYVGFASFCDFEVKPPLSPVLGWMFGFNAASLAQISGGDVFGTTYLDSIWQGGVAPAADAQGNLFFTTGNGPYDGQHNFGMSLLKLSASLAALDSFTTRNQAAETASDLDLSSAGVMLVPDEPGPFAHLAFHEGKQPIMRAFNRDRLGGYSGGPSALENIVTSAYLTPCDPSTSATCGNPSNSQSQAGGLWGGLGFYTGPNAQQYVVAADNFSGAHSFALNTSPSVSLRPAAASSVKLPNEGGATPVISSNGTLPGSAVVWLLNRADPTFALEAYDAATMKLLYSANAGQWHSPTASSMLAPTVANGRVYVPAQVLGSGGGQVAMYGLLGSAATAAQRRASAASAPIVLAGPIVYGPGSRITARPGGAPVVPATAAVRPAAHAFYGVLRRNERGSLLLQTRAGRILTVDAGPALAHGFAPSDLAVGRVYYVTANPSRAPLGGLSAVSIFHLRRSLDDLPPDR